MRSLLLIILLVSCNPVKQVLRDPDKFNEVAAEVIRQGYCANDTLLIVKSDTIVMVDSLIEIYSDTIIVNDTAYITMWNNRNFYKTFTIHDTLQSVIVDNARLKLLQTDLDKQTVEAMQWRDKACMRLGQVIILLIGIFAYLFIKFRK